MSCPEFQVALVLPDLRREESLASVLSSVTHLSKLSEHIFSTIEAKCDEFLSQLEGFNKVVINPSWKTNIFEITLIFLFQRVDDASAKIEALRNSKKATVVFSSARYPGTSSGSYREIFPKDAKTKNISPKQRVITEKLQEFNTKTLQQKLQFYSFKAKRRQEEPASGLGPLPQGYLILQ